VRAKVECFSPHPFPPLRFSSFLSHFFFRSFWLIYFFLYEYDTAFALKNWQRASQFNLAHKLKKAKIVQAKIK